MKMQNEEEKGVLSELRLAQQNSLFIRSRISQNTGFRFLTHVKFMAVISFSYEMLIHKNVWWKKILKKSGCSCDSWSMEPSQIIAVCRSQPAWRSSHNRSEQLQQLEKTFPSAGADATLSTYRWAALLLSRISTVAKTTLNFKAWRLLVRFQRRKKPK